MREACVLLIAMFEVFTDDWRKASFDQFKAAVDSVIFWHQTVQVEKDYLSHIQTIATNNAISRRFFVVFEYENPLPAYQPSEKEIQFALESVVRNFRSYLSRCGNSIVEFEKETEENEFLLQLFYTLLDHYNTAETSLQDKVDRAFRMRLSGDNLGEMCTADYACPEELDFTHAKYVVIDGVYHAYLYIPSAGFKTLVGAAWLSPLINAGEAIDVDLFLHKMPADRMQVQGSRITQNSNASCVGVLGFQIAFVKQICVKKMAHSDLQSLTNLMENP